LNRRQFLKALSLLGLTGLSAGSITGCRPTTGPSQQIPITGWLGEDPSAGRRHWDGNTPTVLPPQPDETMDVVIVGAGISGLTAAFDLRHTDKLLILESNPQPGGNAKSGQYQGVEFALGSAYFVETTEPFASLYDAIGLPMTPLRQPEDWLAEAPGMLTPLEKSGFSAGFDQLQRHVTQLSHKPDFPAFPIDQASTASLALDKMTLAAYLQPLDLPTALLQWVDAYCRSSLGCGLNQASAFVGLNFLSELALPVYALPGGNAGMVRRLVQHVGQDRVRTGAETFRVQPAEFDKVHVSYWHQGRVRTVRAKTVILAMPLVAASRVLSHSPAGLGTLPYGSYAVANLCFDQQVLGSGYDTWMPAAQHFTDVVDATYCLPKQASTQTSPVSQAARPQVLTVYAPLPDSGRQRLMAATPQQAAQPLLTELNQWLPSLPVPATVAMTRYGQQLLSSRSGIIHQVRGLPQQLDNVLFAHSDGQGASSVEAAILQGLNAARLAKTQLV
jgi:protoporphyrinogen oxidase